MSKLILVVIEQRDGKIKKSSLEAVSKAAALAQELNYETLAVIPASSVEDSEKIAQYGIGKVVTLSNSEFLNYSPSGYAKAVSEFAKECDAEVLLFSNTALGKDLAPRIAPLLGAGIVSDCISLEVQNGELVAIRPVYAGKAQQKVKVNSTVKVFTLRPNVFQAVEKGSTANVETKNVVSPDLSTTVSEIKRSAGKLDVAEADIIVSGGRGLKESDNFHLVEELAAALGGAVGASRAVVDAGWRPHGEQVGQTGKTVTPSLYVACGISGAIQHLAGMASSKYIVAINKDKDAPIFTIADYGIVGDVFEILPVLRDEIKKVTAN
jgi:electron transfer flavoprotein alpha subunit